MLGLSFVAVVRGEEVAASCGVVSTPLSVRGIEVAQATARGIRHLADGGRSDEEVTEQTEGMWQMAGTWLSAFAAELRGEPAPERVENVTSAAEQAQAAALTAAGCTPTTNQCVGLGSASQAFSAEQKKIAATFVQVARDRDLPDRAIVLALAGAFVESGVRNLDYGHSSSVGVLQLIDTNGTLAQRMDPAYSVGWFYDGLVRVPNWQTRPLTQVVQAVQRSAYPDRYAAWEDDAEALLAAVGRQDLAQFGDDLAQCTGAIDGTVATWNSGAWNSTANVLAGFRDLAGQAGVIAGQELSSESRRAAIERALPSSWKMYPRPSDKVQKCRRECGTRYGTSVPILVDTDRYQVVGQGRRKVITDKVRVELGADGHTTGPKFVTWVTLRDNAGRRFSVVNTHLVVSATPAKPRRWAQWKRQVAATLTEAARLSSDPVVITCDCNQQENPFAEKGYADSSSVLGVTLKTHTNRTLDYVATAGAQPVDQQLGPAHGSDHRPLLVTFRGATAAAAAPAGWDMPGNKTVDQAVAYMEQMARDQTPIPVGRCLHYVALAYGHPTTAQVFGRYWARDVYTAMPARFKHAGTGEPPRGALVFWDTSGPGHIALSLGGGKVASTDYPRAGVIGVASIDEIDRWGKRIGWTAPYFDGRTKVER